MGSEKMNVDLERERKGASFDPEQLTYILDGGEPLTERRREVEAFVQKEDVFTKGPTYHFLSRQDKYDNGVRKAVHYMKKIQEIDETFPADAYWYRKHVFPNEEAPFGLHFGMFLPTLESQCTPEQREKWVPLAKNFEIIGTYAQTEMGHGTHIRALETTSTYDPKTEEFVIHSPTLTSTKWWPGGLGKTSDHVILMAQLYTQGKCYGMQSFVVQIRDLITHEPLKGVTVGDIGPKFGYESIDNGFLRFDHYRIPRDNMLMKNAQVTKDGTFMKNAKNSRLSYGTMVFVRAMLIEDIAGKGLAQACTIAVRYSCVRHQSELKPGGPEPQIMDFLTQQYKLLPLLATTYAILFTGRHMRDLYFQTNYEIQQGNVELLPELHALSSCLKAYSTYTAMFGIEQCRMACGGHGYSQASGIPKIYATTTPSCTYEGENTVLYLQTARYLMKAYDQSKGANHLTGSVAYLSQPNNAKSQLGADLDLGSLLEAYKYRAARLVNKAGLKYSKFRAQQEQYLAWNNSSVDLVKASEAHAHLYVVDQFVKKVESVEDKAIQRVLRQLCQLYACYVIGQNAVEYLEDGYMSPAQLELVHSGALALLSDIRPNAVCLVDAFDFNDHFLGSVLGRHDGNVYENLLKWAQDSPLNETEVHPSYEKYIKPFREEMRKSKL